MKQVNQGASRLVQHRNHDAMYLLHAHSTPCCCSVNQRWCTFSQHVKDLTCTDQYRSVHHCWCR
jgi:hypothetical protein